MKRLALLAGAAIALAPAVGLYVYGGTHLAVPIVAYLIATALAVIGFALLRLTAGELGDGGRSAKHKPVEKPE
jgi:divalent metal cation (Fe/Co/Zn/Cd) transporter